MKVRSSFINGLFTTVWCGVTNFGVTGPYSFEEEDEHAVTVTSARYVEMLRNFLTSEASCGIKLSTIWFQQYRSTAHTARTFIVVIQEILVEHVISLCCKLPWPACSCALSALKQKCTPLDHRLFMTSRSQFGNKFQQYQKTWQGKQGWKSVYAIMGDILVMCYSKRNKQRHNEMYVE
jgi:hypothetical protein